MTKKFPKKHHYVPQFLLREFSKNKNNLWAFDKTSARTFGVNISDAAAEKDFYTLPDDLNLTAEQRVSAELALADLDSRFASAIQEFNRNLNAATTLSPIGFPNFTLQNELLHELSLMAVYQTVRTREFRENLAQLELLNTKAMFDFFKETPEGKEMLREVPPECGGFNIQLTEGTDTLRQFDMLFNSEFIEKLQTHCENKVWSIGINQTDTPFALGDSPVVMVSHAKRGKAWGAPGMEIAMPVNSKYILIWTSPSLYEKDKFGLSIGRNIDCKSIALTKENVIYFNSLSYLQATRYIYQETDNFNLFIDMNKTVHADSKNPFRKRAAVHALGEKYVVTDDYRTKGIPLNYK